MSHTPDLDTLLATLSTRAQAIVADTTPVSPGAALPLAEPARIIDHTLLKPDATADDVRRVCGEARHHGFFSVCISGLWVPAAVAQLRATGVLVCTVAGFPLGAMSTAAKAFEAREAARAGAGEIDMVLAIGLLKSGEYRAVHDDIRAVVEAAAPAAVKVILECSALTDEEKVAACLLARAAGAAFVKTSTGFGAGGATVEDVALLRRTVGDSMGVKASGGIRSADDLHRMVAAGASRVGASSSVDIVGGRVGSSGY